MKLEYWIAECLNDAACYSIIGKTKKAVQTQLDSHWSADSYGPIEKRAIHYKDAFDLFDLLTGESGGRNY